MDKKKKAVAYVRISSMRQVNNESPVTQRTAIQQFADNNNIEIVEWFEDIAKSGKNTDREGLQNLLNYALNKKNNIDHWLVYNMRRASRDNDSYTRDVKLVLGARGITVRSATEPAVNDTKEGRFMENLLVALGQLDNEGKAEVTKDNMRSLAHQGYYQHPPVVGYLTHKIPNDLGKLRPSLKFSDMAPKVKQVLERFSVGDISKAELARYAGDAGLRSRYGKKLSEDSINRLLSNPTYAGYICDSLTEFKPVPGKHEPIISFETYERNMSILHPANSRKNEVHLQKNSAYPLKGLLLCSNCNQLMYASAPKTGSGGYSPRYHCARKSCRGVTKSVKAISVHDDFKEMLSNIMASEGVLRLYKEILIREASTSIALLNARISTTRDKLDDIGAARLKTLRKFTDDVITIEEKSELVNDLDQQKIEVAAQLRELESQQSIRESDIEMAINIMRNVSKQWSSAAFDVQLRFQNMLFPDGVIYDLAARSFGTSRISPLYRYVVNEKDAEASSKSYLVERTGLEPQGVKFKPRHS